MWSCCLSKGLGLEQGGAVTLARWPWLARGKLTRLRETDRQTIPASRHTYISEHQNRCPRSDQHAARQGQPRFSTKSSSSGRQSIRFHLYWRRAQATRLARSLSEHRQMVTRVFRAGSLREEETELRKGRRRKGKGERWKGTEGTLGGTGTAPERKACEIRLPLSPSSCVDWCCLRGTAFTCPLPTRSPS